MKHEWRKQEKQWYLPKEKPEVVDVPAFNFYTIKGAGNPNKPEFGNYIEALYAVSYAVRMSPKKDLAPPSYFEYTVYPLEGIWDITDEAKKHFTGEINKDDLVFKLMIRQPEFVTEAFAKEMLEFAKAKKKLPLLDEVKFESITEGKCIQALHLGSYDNERATFDKMEAFAKSLNLTRSSMLHREIYLSDARKVPAEKLKTVLRFKV